MSQNVNFKTKIYKVLNKNPLELGEKKRRKYTRVAFKWKLRTGREVSRYLKNKYPLKNKIVGNISRTLPVWTIKKNNNFNNVTKKYRMSNYYSRLLIKKINTSK